MNLNRHNRLHLAPLLIALTMTITTVSAFSCNKSAYHDAVVAEHQFKTVTMAFQKAEIKEANNGRIDPAEHKAIEQGVEQVGLAAQVLVTALQNGADNATVQAHFATVSAALTDLLNNGVLHVKNETSKAILTTSIAAVRAILDNVGQLLSAQTSTTTTTGPAPVTK